jgi:hypothetical protein
MNLLGGVAAKDVYGKGNGKVHQGFHNMVHDWPKDWKGDPACEEEVAPIKVGRQLAYQIRTVWTPYHWQV